MADETQTSDNSGDDEKKLKPGHAEGGTKDYPSTSPETPHAQRDGYTWDDETGWNPPQS